MGFARGALHDPERRAQTAIPLLEPSIGNVIPDWFSRWPVNNADPDALGNADDETGPGVGNCVPAARCQITRLWGGAADKGMAFRLYSMWTGFDPATMQPDNGTDTLAAMFASCATPTIDMAGRPWPILWAKVDHEDEQAILRALVHFPLEITVQLPAGDLGDDPWSWADAPGAFVPGPEAHRIVLGGHDATGWRVRTWGMDFSVHPRLFTAMLLAVDVPVPHPEYAPADLLRDGVDYAHLIANQPQLA